MWFEIISKLKFLVFLNKQGIKELQGFRNCLANGDQSNYKIFIKKEDCLNYVFISSLNLGCQRLKISNNVKFKTRAISENDSYQIDRYFR